jgi:membrane-associated protease RseP (regulator of RpoE activity)
MPRWLTWLAWLSMVCTVVILFGIWPLQGGDLWMHLTVGRWIWQHRAVPLVDDFSYLSAGATLTKHGQHILGHRRMALS